jgi:hypothetical protein
LHPDVRITVQKESEQTVLVLLQCAGGFNVWVQAKCLRIESATWHPEFGVSRATSRLVVPFSEPMVRTEIWWG